MDEADEMLDMGFAEELEELTAALPETHHTALFSATLPELILEIANKHLKNPKHIVIEKNTTEEAPRVPQVAYVVARPHRLAALARILEVEEAELAICFARTRVEVDEVTEAMRARGFSVEALHGGLDQASRDRGMKRAKNGSIELIVATDVAARGIDLENLTHVVNLGLPASPETYVHRIGRTGRAGKTGTSIAIINLREKGKMREIERIIKKKFDIGTLPTGKEICEQQLIKLIDDIEKVKVDEEEIETFLPGIYRKLEWLSKEDLIKRVVSMEFNRFLDYYKNAAEIEQPKGNEKRESQKERKDHGSDREKTSRKAEKGYTRLFLNLGKTDGFYANQIIELINRNLKKERIEIGRIDLMQNFSFFEIAEAQAPMVIKALNKTTANGRRVIVEVAGENNGKSDKSGKKQKNATAKPAEKKGKKGSKADKGTAGTRPSREERGYTSPRGPKKKDDWKQFFVHDDRPLKGEEPDFMAEQ